MWKGTNLLQDFWKLSSSQGARRADTDSPIYNHWQESKRTYQQSLSWVTVCDQQLLPKEGGHGVIRPLTFHSVGFHLLFGGFLSFIDAIVRPLPLVKLHHLLDLMKTGLLCIQCL